MLVALGVALAAMGALHVVQPELDPVAEPVSFYVWGRQGWLLPVALAAFGVAVLVLARAPPAPPSPWSRRILVLIGAGLLLAAAVPSDRWFPWEHPPTLSGLVHAAAAMMAPALLVVPMVTRASRARRMQPWIVLGYVAALMGAAASLAIGFVRDGPPPWIGGFERLLALTAIVWVCAAGWSARGLLK